MLPPTHSYVASALRVCKELRVQHYTGQMPCPHATMHMAYDNMHMYMYMYMHMHMHMYMPLKHLIRRGAPGTAVRTERPASKKQDACARPCGCARSGARRHQLCPAVRDD